METSLPHRQYFGLQDATLWSIVRDEIPAIRLAIESLHAQPDDIC